MTVLAKSQKKYLPQKAVAPRTQADSDEEADLKIGNFTKTSSVYQINKVLSQEQYAVGKNVQNYLRDFALQYKNLRESSAFLP